MGRPRDVLVPVEVPATVDDPGPRDGFASCHVKVPAPGTSADGALGPTPRRTWHQCPTSRCTLPGDRAQAPAPALGRRLRGRHARAGDRRHLLQRVAEHVLEDHGGALERRQAHEASQLALTTSGSGGSGEGIMSSAPSVSRTGPRARQRKKSSAALWAMRTSHAPGLAIALAAAREANAFSFELMAGVAEVRVGRDAGAELAQPTSPPSTTTPACRRGTGRKAAMAFARIVVMARRPQWPHCPSVTPPSQWRSAHAPSNGRRPRSAWTTRVCSAGWRSGWHCRSGYSRSGSSEVRR